MHSFAVSQKTIGLSSPARSTPCILRNTAVSLRHRSPALLPSKRAEIMAHQRPSAVSKELAEGSFPPKAKDDVTGAMLEPSVVNTPWFRILAVLIAVSLVAGSTALMPVKFAAFVHVSTFGIWLGTNFWNTFFVGLTMFKNMPRQTFGRVQAKLNPQYFTLLAGANMVLLGTLLMSGSSPEYTKAAIVLGVALAASVLEWIWIEPFTTKLMFQRYDLENMEGEKTAETKAQIAVLFKEFNIYHAASALLSLVILACGFAHGWFLGSIMTL